MYLVECFWPRVQMNATEALLKEISSGLKWLEANQKLEKEKLEHESLQTLKKDLEANQAQTAKYYERKRKNQEIENAWCRKATAVIFSLVIVWMGILVAICYYDTTPCIPELIKQREEKLYYFIMIPAPITLVCLCLLACCAASAYAPKDCIKCAAEKKIE